MSINKKNLLNYTPEKAGLKDAIHVAIVSVRAGKPLKQGESITLNSDGEAIPSPKGFGVVSPFYKGVIGRGEIFWALLNMEEIPTVTHIWEHPTFSFEAPKSPPKFNACMIQDAERLGISYVELMSACSRMVNQDKQTEYKGNLSEQEVEDGVVEWSDIYSNWADETLHEFQNNGTECCPEYDYPGCPFYFGEKDA